METKLQTLKNATTSLTTSTAPSAPATTARAPRRCAAPASSRAGGMARWSCCTRRATPRTWHRPISTTSN